MIRDHQNRKARGTEAIVKERQLMKEKRELEEEIQCIERKKTVQQKESENAHKIA